MSEYYIRFIPDDPHYELEANKINEIKSLDWCGDHVRIAVNETIQLADAGENFESVSCPFCQYDLMDFWGQSMDAAYSDENGFELIDIITPCCNMTTTLQNLTYSFQQGFYKTIIELQPELQNDINCDIVCEQLMQITDTVWRVVRAYY